MQIIEPVTLLTDLALAAAGRLLNTAMTGEDHRRLVTEFLDHFPEAFYFRTFSSIHQLFYRKLENYRPGIDYWGGSPVTIPKAGSLP